MDEDFPGDQTGGNTLLIVCENLVKIYKLGDFEILALQGLDLTIDQGEMVGIAGVSGSGKTTLMNVLGGLVRPTAGRSIVDSKNLLKLTNHELDAYRRHEVGFVRQQGARNLLSYLTALENVEFPMTLSGRVGPQMRRRAEMLLELVGLEDRRHSYLTTLSGGEQQRVAIAVALVTPPGCSWPMSRPENSIVRPPFRFITPCSSSTGN